MNQNESEIIEEGPVSTVSRTYTALGDAPPQWLAVKSSTITRKFAKEPHDIKKELRILSSISHPHVIDVVNHSEEVKWSTLEIWMPYIPISLPDILSSTHFSPHPFGMLLVDEKKEGFIRDRFTILAQSIMYQVLLGVAFLHAEQIAHRDIKPNNVLLTREGCVKLIDFGIVWKDEEKEGKHGDLWPEHREEMYFEVSTAPYRSPELLFGPRSYDPYAIDLWSLGATFAEFFTPLRLCPEDDDGDEDSQDEDEGEDEETEEQNKGLKPFIIPSKPSFAGGKWYRDRLFDGTRGELGLAWSIFKIRGTPTTDTWPDFEKLPDAGGVTFTVVPSVPLATFLPHLPSLPPSQASVNEEVGPGGPPSDDKVEFKPTALDLISRFLVYPPERRLKVAEALLHPWFSDEILLPDGLSSEYELAKHVILKWEGKTLGEWLQFILTGTESA